MKNILYVYSILKRNIYGARNYDTYLINEKN